VRKVIVCILLLCLVRAALGIPKPEGLPEAVEPLSKLTVGEATALGVVEGVTEFLPISSTGHLIVLTSMLGLDSEQPFLTQTGAPVWYRKPEKDKPGELLTVKVATEAYIVVIQLGAILAIVPIVWSQLMLMATGVFRRNPAGLRLLRNLIIAFLPAAISGLLLHEAVRANLYTIGNVVLGLVAGSVLMFVANLVPSWREERHAYRSELTALGAAGIGIMQCFAIWPGTSRPMLTIVGGYFAGLTPGAAAGFSFTLGFVTLLAATLYKVYKSGALIIYIFGWPNVLLGIGVAGCTAYFSVRFFINLLLRKGLAPFAWYRLALAAYLWFFFSTDSIE
jgi:undecaprenyl-diphosphatase